jgi:hypothetical protein
MSPHRSRVIAPLVAALVLAGAGCSATETIASSDAADADPADPADPSAATNPPPTIGLGSEIDREPGADAEEASGDPGVRAADADLIDTVVMIGDSITVGSTPALEERFEQLGFFDVTIEAENGKRIAQEVSGNPSGVSIADTLVATDVAADPLEELWVVALGTNDIGAYAERDEVEAVVDEMLDSVPDDASLVWVDTYLPNDVEGSDLVNDVVRERLADRGNAVVAPWSAVADRDGVLSADMIHPSDQGSEVFAATVAATIDRFLDA